MPTTLDTPTDSFQSQKPFISKGIQPRLRASGYPQGRRGVDSGYDHESAGLVQPAGQMVALGNTRRVCRACGIADHKARDLEEGSDVANLAAAYHAKRE
jgi:hypothetical protein